MIDEEATFKMFGYRSPELTQCSKKWIVVFCARCKKTRICQYRSYSPFKNRGWCGKCRKYLNPIVELDDPEYQYKLSQTLINEERTKKEFGYYSIDLSPNSMCKVYAICRGCGKERLLSHAAYTNRSGFCRKCAAFDPVHIIRDNPNYLTLLTQTGINEDRTFKDFGYYSLDLGLGSSRRVWSICKVCGAERLNRFDTHNTKSGMCIKCSQKNLSATRQGILLADWKNFTREHPYPAEFNETLRVKVRNNANNLCEICNKPEERIALSVHHIDRDKNNNTMGNLIAVCASCHGKLHNAVTTSHLQYIKSLECYEWN